MIHSIDREAARATIDLISGKWVLPVLFELGRGASCYNDLARAVDAEHKTLSRALRRLEAAGVVQREVVACRPVRVRYQLTLSGSVLLARLTEFARWRAGQQHDLEDQ